MKKILTIFTFLLLTSFVFAKEIRQDKVLGKHTTEEGLTYTVLQERDMDIYVTVESINEKDKLLIEADTINHAKYIIEELDKALRLTNDNPIKTFIKGNKRYGEWERDDETREKYFELDDELFIPEELYENDFSFDFLDD